jgi:DNA-binding transcriptional ArsR family regulator
MSNQSALALDALGDPSRRQILELLAERPRAVGELAAAMPIGRPAVSKHLKVLEGAGLVDHESRGTRNLYALAPEGLVDLQQWLVATWDTALDSFATFVERHRVEHRRVEHRRVEQHQEKGPP